MTSLKGTTAGSPWGASNPESCLTMRACYTLGRGTKLGTPMSNICVHSMPSVLAMFIYEVAEATIEIMRDEV